MSLSNSTRLLRVTAGLAALALVGCSDDPPSIDGTTLDPLEHGPFAVGYRTAEISYDEPSGDGLRTIPLSIWYPVDRAVADRIESRDRPQYFLARSKVAFPDAPPAKPAFDSGFPVLVHSHGHGGWNTQGYPLFERLAEQGFLVIVPAHVGDLFNDVGNIQVPYHEYFASHYERVFDVREALDFLAELPSNDPLAGRVDASHAILSGHSRGTYTVFATLGARAVLADLDALCAAGDFDASGGCPASERDVYERDISDSRFVGGVPMAGSGDQSFIGGVTGMNAITAPIFMMTGGANDVGAAAIFDQVTNPPMTWVDYADGCHEVFNGVGGDCGKTIDIADSQRAFTAFVAAFMRRELQADPSETVSAILAGTQVVSDQITFYGR